MDWLSRKVLSWRVSNSMEADFCVEALKEAIARYGKPEIMNSDQGSQGGFNRSSQQGLYYSLPRGARGFLPETSNREFSGACR
jgi:transposase InsO family protein